MRRLFLVLALVLTLFILAVCVSATSAQQSLENDTASMGKLLPLIQKGLVIPVKVEPADEDGLVWVEPLLWKKLTHVEKHRLLQDIGAFYRVHNKLQETKIKVAGASDITSKESLGWIDLQTRKVTIKK